jgi:hypothetical protein
MKFTNEFIFIFEKIVIGSFPIMPFKVYNYEGVFIRSFEVVLKKGFAVEIMDVHENFLLFKQFKDELIIIDLKNGSFFESRQFITPKNIDYIRLAKDKNYIICFYAFGIHVWSFKAKKLKEFSFQVYREDVFFINRINFLLMAVKMEEKEKKCKYDFKKGTLHLVVINLANLAQIIEIPTECKSIDLVMLSENYSILYYAEQECILKQYSILSYIEKMKIL